MKLPARKLYNLKGPPRLIHVVQEEAKSYNIETASTLQVQGVQGGIHSPDAVYGPQSTTPSNVVASPQVVNLLHPQWFLQSDQDEGTMGFSIPPESGPSATPGAASHPPFQTPTDKEWALVTLRGCVAKIKRITTQLTSWTDQHFDQQPWTTQVLMFMERKDMLPAMETNLNRYGAEMLGRDPIPPEFEKGLLLGYWLDVSSALDAVRTMDQQLEQWRSQILLDLQDYLWPMHDPEILLEHQQKMQEEVDAEEGSAQPPA
ncbi:uncharacterized protein LTR77_003254 [Saxophila tyrrhenica]|uniref:Uncharacterized protein n=1 Tax=Saxophila tyrrhenica TaxID=1690608 RepID=A0AAV9PK08_9PEZI|nr:hypothetical protein LTR77_003254 [Saxophila tyrrhenica]